MAKIDLKNICVEFPVYNINHRSFKKRFLRMATGGTVIQDVNDRNHMVISALRDISFSLRDGDRVGLIGHNGSGKSTLLRLLANIYEPSRGNLRIDGKVSPLFNLTYGIEGEFTGKENIVIRSTMLGLSSAEIKNKVEEISEFSGLGDYLSMPIRTYSSGMFVRLAFAISTSIEPDILLIDEIFGAGDYDFMQKARKKMSGLLEESSIVLLASHHDGLIKEFCNKALLLDSGTIKYFGDVETALALYHPPELVTLDKAL